MTSTSDPAGDRKLRMALIGGGGAGFFGRIHALAAELDQRAELVAGAFSSDPEKSRLAAAAFGVAADRGYGSYRELIESERRLPADQRIDFLTIATPNHTHFEIAQAALEAGFHVVCEKPLTNNVDQARNLADRVAQTGAVFAVAHGYSGYPLVRQAREMIAAGELGQVFAARVTYLQGGKWSVEPGRKPSRAAWKGDPAQAGPSGTLADIGTHAFHLLRYTTGLQPESLCAALAQFHPGRPLDDYGQIVLRCGGGSLATIAVSQVTHGRLNDLSLEVDGTRGSLVWRQMEPDQLVVRRHNQPVQIYERNQRTAYSETVRAWCRLPGGHPEGFLEALANVYRETFDAIIRGAGGRKTALAARNYPTVEDGLEGVYFVHLCLASHAEPGGWKPWQLAEGEGPTN